MAEDQFGWRVDRERKEEAILLDKAALAALVLAAVVIVGTLFMIALGSTLTPLAYAFFMQNFTVWWGTGTAATLAGVAALFQWAARTHRS